MEQLSDLARREKLSREMTHRPQADIETLRGRDPLTDWALGVRERTLNPLATLAGEAKRFKGLSPEEMGMELVGGGIAGTFIGKSAKTWKSAMKDTAEKLEKQGVPPEEIWKQTGTFRGADKEWRQEIPDNLAKYDPDALKELKESGTFNYKSDTQPLAGVIEHKPMFAAYPSMGDIPVHFMPQQNMKGSYGAYAPDIDRLTLGDVGTNQLNPALHETQHAIQHREGWARGGSPAQMEREQEAAYATIQDINKNMSQVSTMMDEAKAAGDIGRVKYLKDQYDSLMGTRQELIPSAQADAYESYRNLAGEAEARLTQARMNMTSEQRLHSYPPSMFDVPMESQIVRY